MSNFKRINIFIIIIIFVVISVPRSVIANEGVLGSPLGSPLGDVHAAAHILIEAQSGRIISENDAHRRMFPAGTTMILTSILAYEHIGMDEIIVAGNEVTNLPHAMARNFHEVGEAISGINLIRGMLIGAGSDTANIVVMEVARRLDGPGVTFARAQVIFARLMNEKAAYIGALDSNFVNPHGYHHDSHFTTAYDMAQIARYAMGIDVIAQIAGNASFSGHMAGGYANVPAGASGFSRTWNSPNELLQSGANNYPYATGLRTGRTNQAGDSLVATAARDDVNLISVTFNSPEINYAPTRWQDNINLFEYGFDNFAHRVFLDEGALVGEIAIYDPPLGDYDNLGFFSTQEGIFFLSISEFERLQRQISFLPDMLVYSDESGRNLFMGPIYEGEHIGYVAYYLDDALIFSTNIYAMRDIGLRTTATDIEYHVAWINQTFFSAEAIPYWVAAVSVFILLLVLFILARNAIRRKKGNQKYKWKY